MTISIFRLISSIIIVALFSCAASAQEPQLKAVTLHAKIAKTHPDFKTLGSYPEFTRYNIHRELAPDQFDVLVRGEGRQGQKVFLEVKSIVGLTGWQQNEGITDHKLLESSATPMPLLHTATQTLNTSGSFELSWKELPLKQWLDTFAEKDLWVKTLGVVVYLDVLKGEKELAGNRRAVEIPIDPAD